MWSAIPMRRKLAGAFPGYVGLVFGCIRRRATGRTPPNPSPAGSPLNSTSVSGGTPFVHSVHTFVWYRQGPVCRPLGDVSCELERYERGLRAKVMRVAPAGLVAVTTCRRRVII